MPGDKFFGRLRDEAWRSWIWGTLGQELPSHAPQPYPFLPYHPIRVYKVVSTYGELQLMRLIPLFGHFARFQLTNDKRTDMIKNINYGSGKNLLDVYIGDSSSTSSPPSPSVDDDAGSDHTVESNGSPVIIYVYGGAWDSGHKSMLMPMAQNLANQGYIVVVPDYTHYPTGKIEDMVKDVQEAVVWTTVNITRYGGDPSNIYLMGSGSGAHIASLAIIKDAVDQLGGVTPPTMESDPTPVVSLPRWPETNDNSHRQHQQTLHPLTHNSTQLKERVHGLILFSGVFDITFYYAYLHKRGIEEVSAMPRVMHRSPNNYLACSPSWLLATANATLEKPELLERVMPKSILIVHGEQDRLVPAHLSQTFIDLLYSAEIPNINAKLYRGYGHLDPAIDLILPTNPLTASLLNELAKVIRPAGTRLDYQSSSMENEKTQQAYEMAAPPYVVHANVYHATWGGRSVAIKKFTTPLAELQRDMTILREVSMLETLCDKYIIQFYGTAPHENSLALVMEYAKGGSLTSAIQSGRLDWPNKTRIAQEVLRGLAYIHYELVLHRDLKSSHILLTRHMEVRLCSFGMAKVKPHTGSSDRTTSPSTKRSPRWMAPELFAARPKYSTKSDMFSLGVVMWEMAVNCTIPFQDQLDDDIVVGLVKSGVRQKLPDDTPPEYRQWVERCWDQDPVKRPEASEVVIG
ncbi:hypothetical protein BGZ73_007304 [Actinomortierella ambigua]|nr:hypothetical protein BGZ73_007304 [Actinomortierella ambigua]